MKVVTSKYGDVFIRWQYTRSQDITSPDTPVITKAFLERKIGEKEKEVIKEVSVKKHPKETNNKQLARRYALLALVQNSFTREGQDLLDRKNIWAAYGSRN